MPKHNLVDQVRQLKAQQEAFQTMLITDMSNLFGIPVSTVEDHKIDTQAKTETGILVSGGVRYRYQVGNGKKVLEPIEDE